jgi:hypothetical protein
MKKLLVCLLLACISAASGQQLISDLVVSRTVKLTGTITPTQISANTNDYAPTGFSTAYKLRLSTDASRNLTGLAGGAEGRDIVISNVGSFPLVLKNQSSSSSAANRFALGGVDLTLVAGASVEMIYDGTSSYWRMLGDGAGTGDVTHSTSLTSNAVVLGAGSADVKVAAGFFTDGTSKLTLGQAGTSVGGLLLANATSGTVEFRPVTGALSTSVLTVPAATDTLALLAASQTFTNKTLTAPVIATIVNIGTLTLPTSTDTMVARATTDTLTNKTLTSPKVGTSILDTNGLSLLGITATASAVNYITLANAATANNPTFTASGSDTDVGINLTPKGRGTIRIGSIELQSTNTTSGASFFGNSYYDGSNFKYRASDFASAMQMISGGIYYYTAASGSAGATVSFNISAEVSAAGNFLVGTTSETGLSGAGGLRVASTTASSSTTTGAAIISGGLGVAGQVTAGGAFKTTDSTASSSTTTGSGIFAGGVGVAGQIYAAGVSVVQGSGVNTLTLSDGSGNLGAVTRYLGAVTQKNFELGNQVQASNAFTITPSTTNGGATFTTPAFSVSGAGAIAFNTYGAGTLTTDSSGNITATSDARAKDTISVFTTGLASVRQLQPKKYSWKPETGLNPDDINVAIYAQDLIAAGIPEAVSTQRTEETKDASGKLVRHRVPSAYYSVSDRVVISALINAVKELAAKNDALEVRLATLEATAKTKAK